MTQRHEAVGLREFPPGSSGEHGAAPQALATAPGFEKKVQKHTKFKRETKHLRALEALSKGLGVGPERAI